MKRFLIASDGKRWYVRKIAFSVQDNLEGLMVYKCDEHLGGPFGSAGEAAAFVETLDATSTEKYPTDPDLVGDAEDRWATPQSGEGT